MVSKHPYVLPSSRQNVTKPGNYNQVYIKEQLSIILLATMKNIERFNFNLKSISLHSVKFFFIPLGHVYIALKILRYILCTHFIYFIKCFVWIEDPIVKDVFIPCMGVHPMKSCHRHIFICILLLLYLQ